MNTLTKINLLRVSAWTEGISYLLLFGISMPLKYLYGIKEPNYIIGMIHGVLFILYNLMVVFVGIERKWTFKILCILVILSLIPFGTFYADRKHFKD
tara:strand:- start:297 stop:587 length:291 start_codon:yes stop_codon:yes gene_type:complete